MANITWPDGKRFAFTIFDDTDLTTLANGPPVYAFLQDQGFLTTKSVWPLRGNQVPEIGGATCVDDEYLAWAQQLQGQGFEIALHNVAFHSSTREVIAHGLEQFKQFFGSYPRSHANHAACLDNLYWGVERVSGINKLLYNVLTCCQRIGKSLGHRADSDMFWADLCKQRISYVRNFVFDEINTLKACPYMPYHDADRPYVNNWFACSEGGDAGWFNRTIAEKNQDRLEEEGGACIMYTHLGKGFCKNGKLNGEFRRLMERLSRRHGWFVPVSTLLDYLKEQKGPCSITPAQRLEMERRWLFGRIITSWMDMRGLTSCPPTNVPQLDSMPMWRRFVNLPLRSLGRRSPQFRSDGT